jgi:hypothetical protein
MPDWKYFRDRAGNVYYIDRTGKFHAPHKPTRAFPVITPEEVEYYIAHARELMPYHPVQGLAIVKSILSLPEDNSILVSARREASAQINRCIKRNGDRYAQWNRDASIVMVRFGGLSRLIDDEMMFVLEMPYHAVVIRNRERQSHKYKYSGLLLGLGAEKFQGGDAVEFARFDVLLAVDTEAFSVPLKGVDLVEENSLNNSGFRDMSRSLIFVDRNRKIYEIGKVGGLSLVGFEAYYVNSNRGHALRLLCRPSLFAEEKAALQRIVESFKTVRSF